MEYILEHGIAELSLRPMAKALGVTHATLVRQFGSKEDLIAEAVVKIRESVLERRAGASGAPDAPSLAVAMWAAWRRLCEPSERRQFVLLFELVAMNERQQGRFGPLPEMLITDFLGPMQSTIQNAGLSRSDARSLATGFLAQVRGLQLDLAVTGDRRRVDAAMRHYIEAMTETRP